jgi:hypothetical protein
MTDAKLGVRLVKIDDDSTALLPTARALRERGFEDLDFDRLGVVLVVAQAHGSVTTEIAA